MYTICIDSPVPIKVEDCWNLYDSMFEETGTSNSNNEVRNKFRMKLGLAMNYLNNAGSSQDLIQSSPIETFVTNKDIYGTSGTIKSEASYVTDNHLSLLKTTTPIQLHISIPLEVEDNACLTNTIITANTPQLCDFHSFVSSECSSVNRKPTSQSKKGNLRKKNKVDDVQHENKTSSLKLIESFLPEKEVLTDLQPQRKDGDQHKLAKIERSKQRILSGG
ncbi:unnamed protein product [Euphydryas editha]|uniref:Uncharacterized protein n=1 Tax=Euphydryas editha TaxID=104508 RepID=A0AAU9TF59_EUPED|nr:unnamed protein product [Euphydryas editha]